MMTVRKKTVDRLIEFYELYRLEISLFFVVREYTFLFAYLLLALFVHEAFQRKIVLFRIVPFSLKMRTALTDLVINYSSPRSYP